MLNESYLLKERKDRMGSHFWQYLGVFLLSKKENKKVTIQRPIEKYNYMHDLWFWDIRDNFDVIKEDNDREAIDSMVVELPCGMRGPSAIFVQKYKIDVISYFRENYKEKYFENIKKIAEERNYKLPWKNIDDAICIQIRFEDMAHKLDVDSSDEFNLYKNWINNDEFIKKYPKYVGLNGENKTDYQCPIDINLFEKKVIELKEKYPEKQIYIITYIKTKRIIDKYNKIVRKHNLKVITNNDGYREAYHTWLMANCHTLVLTKSTFPIMAALYFQGKEIQYQIWPRYASLGLGTKYDKSGWIGFK